MNVSYEVSPSICGPDLNDTFIVVVMSYCGLPFLVGIVGDLPPPSDAWLGDNNCFVGPVVSPQFKIDILKS